MNSRFKAFRIACALSLVAASAWAEDVAAIIEFSSGDVSLPCPELKINLRPIISEKRKGNPLIAAVGIRHASAGKRTSLHALIQPQTGRVHPDGEGEKDTFCGGNHIKILLRIRTEYLDISQRLQCRTQGFRNVGMRRRAFNMVEHLAVDAGL